MKKQIAWFAVVMPLTFLFMYWLQYISALLWYILMPGFAAGGLGMIFGKNSEKYLGTAIGTLIGCILSFGYVLEFR